jgi:hypothetical protein
MILLLKHDNFNFNILLLQNPNRHISFMALIIWTTRDHALILISFLGVNMLFYVADNSYPTTKSSQNINSTISTCFNFRNWTKIQGHSQSVQTSLLPNIPLVPKTSGAPTRQQVFVLGQNTFHTQFKIPKNIMHELSHNHSKNLRHTRLLPCVGPYKNTCNNFGPFIDILSTSEVFSSIFFSFSPLDQVLFLPIYNTPKIKIKPHFF